MHTNNNISIRIGKYLSLLLCLILCGCNLIKPSVEVKRETVIVYQTVEVERIITATPSAAEDTETAAPTKIPPTALPKNTPTSTESDYGTAKNPFRMNEILSNGVMSLTILGWEIVDSTGYDTQPESGNQFIAVHFIIDNYSPNNLDFSADFSIKGNDGTYYSANYSLFHTGYFDAAINGVIDSGELVRDRIGFEIAQDSGPYQLVFTMSGDKKYFVDLGTEATLASIPVSLEYALVQPSSLPRVGQAIEAGSLQITVNSAEATQPSSDWGAPDPGFTYYVVDVTLENTGNVDLNLRDFWLKDSNGFKYMPDFSAAIWLETTSPQNTISAGEKVKGQLAFQIPTDAAGLLLVYDLGIAKLPKTTISLE